MSATLLFSRLIAMTLVTTSLGVSGGCLLFYEQTPADAQLTCTNGDECPPGTSCRTAIERCVVDGLDDKPPALLAGAVVAQRQIEGVHVLDVSFTADEALAFAPRVQVTGALEATIAATVDETAGGAVSTARFDLDVLGASSGTATVVVDLVDAAGNVANGVSVGSVVIDLTPPALAADVVLDGDPAATRARIPAGGSITVSMSPDEPLGAPPELFLRFLLGDEHPCALDDVGPPALFLCADEGDSPADEDGVVVVRMIDVAENSAELETDRVVVFDRAPPQLVDAAVSLVPASSSLLSEPTALTNGTTLVVAVTLDEEIGAPSTAALGGVALQPVPGEPLAFRHTLGATDPLADGSHDVVIQVEDAAGNAGTITAATIVVDRAPPAPPTVDVPDAVVHVRVPFGALTTNEPRFELLTTAAAVEPGAFIAALTGDGAVVGAPRLAGTAVDPSLLGVDVASLFVVTVDAAGNTSTPALVRDVVWTASLGQKIAGSPFPNPSALDIVSRFDGSLFPAAVREAGESDGVFGADGTAIETRGEGSWRRALLDGAVPDGRFDSAAAYDGARGVMVLFGGSRDSGSCDDSGFTGCGGTWELSGPGRSFSRKEPRDLEGDGDPTGRFGHAMAFDAARRESMLFGGKDSSGDCDGSGSVFCGGLWAWNGERWRLVDDGAAAGSPAPRLNHAAAYDARRDRLVMFGGLCFPTGAQFAAACDETWEHDGVEWTLVTPASSSPGARSNHAMAYDDARGVVVLFGGVVSGARRGDTWEWNGTDWSLVTTTTAPSARLGHALAYDEAADDGDGSGEGAGIVDGRVLLFGGNDGTGSCDGSGQARCGRAWSFDGDEWSLVPLDGVQPSPREEAVLAAGPALGGAVVFGGRFVVPDGGVCPDGQASLPAAGANDNCDLQDAHLIAGIDTVTLMALLDVEGDGAPPARSDAGLTFDRVRGVAVLVGGRGEALLDDTWEWAGSGWRFVATPSSPPAGAPGALLFDTTARWLPPCTTGFCAGEHRYDTVTWTPAGVPAFSARERFAVAYDSVRREVVLFGGLQERGLADEADCPNDGTASGIADGEGRCAVGDTWTFDVDASSPAFIQRAVASPGARHGHALAFDEERGVVVLAGGEACTRRDTGGQQGCESPANTDFLDDTWTWDGSAWTEDDGPSFAPGRTSLELAFDPGRRRVLLVGGNAGGLVNCGTGSRFCRDAWEWTGDGWDEQQPADPERDGLPSARIEHALVGDHARDEVLLVGGTSGADETWVWNGGALSVPAHVFRAAFEPAEPLPAIPTRLVVRVVGGGTSDVEGADVLLWTRGAYRSVGVIAGTNLARTDVVVTEADILAGLLVGEDRAVHVAVVPAAASGIGPRATVRTDHVEVEVTYRR